MKEEFNLSEREHNFMNDFWFEKKDVKEFIQRLKEELDHKASQREGRNCLSLEIVDIFIDKFAGEKLI